MLVAGLTQLFFAGVMAFNLVTANKSLAAADIMWTAFSLVVLTTGVVLIASVQVAAIRQYRTPWLMLGTVMLSYPIIMVWYQSGQNRAVSQWFVNSSPPHVDPEYRNQVISERRNSSRCDDGIRWSVNDQPFEVAVTLSGGGYRAAVTHAGLLAALDRHCVPIAYLSTVSGGSIIGGHYALGNRPEDFARVVWKEKPGLPQERFAFKEVIGALTSPSYGSADTYTSHFSRIYFGESTLAELPDTPLYIPNVTDLETVPRNAREIFYKQRAAKLQGSDGRSLDKSIRVADVVAASGAFPGAFAPKRIEWAAADAARFQASAVLRRFIDGGVVENLGVQGLIRLLEQSSLPGGTQMKRPRILIISDASKQSEPHNYDTKVGLIDLLQRAGDITYDAATKALLEKLTGQLDFWRWLEGTAISHQLSTIPWARFGLQARDDEPADVQTVVVPITAAEIRHQLKAYDKCYFDKLQLADVQKHVSSLETLNELPREQVEQAYWTGYALGEVYWPTIACAIKQSRGEVCYTSNAPNGLKLGEPVSPICPTAETIRASLSRQ